MAKLLMASRGFAPVMNMFIWMSEEICIAVLLVAVLLIVQAEKQSHLASCLDKLMTDVQRNLEPKNRDRFTQVGTSS